MSGHTPGPWSQDRCGDILANGEKLLVSGVSMPCGNHPQAAEAKANARLIASAPDMLAALHEVETYLAEREDVIDGDYGQPAPNDEMTLLREVRAALANATGGAKS